MSAPGGGFGEGAHGDEANQPPAGGRDDWTPPWDPPAADYPPPAYSPPGYPPGYPAEYPPPIPPPPGVDMVFNLTYALRPTPPRIEGTNSCDPLRGWAKRRVRDPEYRRTGGPG